MFLPVPRPEQTDTGNKAEIKAKTKAEAKADVIDGANVEDKVDGKAYASSYPIGLVHIDSG